MGVRVGPSHHPPLPLAALCSVTSVKVGIKDPFRFACEISLNVKEKSLIMSVLRSVKLENLLASPRWAGMARELPKTIKCFVRNSFFIKKLILEIYCRIVIIEI